MAWTGGQLPRRFGRAGRALAVVILVAGLYATVTIAAAFQANADHNLSEAMDRQVTEVHETVAAEVGRYVDTLRNLAAATGAQPELTAAGFRALSQNLADQHLAGATGVSLWCRPPATRWRRWRPTGAPAANPAWSCIRCPARRSTGSPC